MSPQSMCNTLFTYVASESQLFLNTQSLFLLYLFTAYGKTKRKYHKLILTLKRLLRDFVQNFVLDVFPSLPISQVLNQSPNHLPFVEEKTHYFQSQGYFYSRNTPEVERCVPVMLRLFSRQLPCTATSLFWSLLARQCWPCMLPPKASKIQKN